MVSPEVLNDGRTKKVLVLLIKELEDGKKEVLMGMHPKQHKRNFPGGAVADREEISGESPQDAAVREVLEETGLKILDSKLLGEITFIFPDERHIDLSIFVAQDWSETDSKPVGLEDLRWYPIENLPYDEMWGTDRYWLTMAFYGVPFEGEMVLDGDGGCLKYNVEIKETDSELRVI